MSNQECILIERCKSGDANAFAELIAPYQQKAYELAFRMTGNHADAEDIAQEALIKVFKSINRFDGLSAFSTWLHRIVSNTAIDLCRSRKRRPAATLDFVGEICDNGPDGDPEGCFDTLFRQRAVQTAITQLPPEQRVALVMRDIEDYSYQEIADALGISIGTIKSRVHRARMALHNIIVRNFPELCSVQYAEGEG